MGIKKWGDIKRAAIGRFFGSLRSFFPVESISLLPFVILRKDRRRFRSPSVHLQGIGTDRIHPADSLMPDRKSFFLSFLPRPLCRDRAKYFRIRSNISQFEQFTLIAVRAKAIRFDNTSLWTVGRGESLRGHFFQFFKRIIFHFFHPFRLAPFC